MKRILCFGDSNTWGYNPRNGSRYNNAWPTVLAGLLPDCEIVSNGKPGRTTSFEGSPQEQINGFSDFTVQFEKVDPEYIILSLGTNDFQKRFNCTAEDVIDSLYKYIEYVGIEKISIVIPPYIEERGYFKTIFEGAAKKSRMLPTLLKKHAEEKGIAVIDANSCISPSPVDGIHWSESEHSLLADLVKNHLSNRF